MVQYIITPWRSQRELLAVRDVFYPSSSDSAPNEAAQKHAVEKVAVWMQRGNCPHSVESTALLLSARLNDVAANSNYCVRAAYSAAFARFVTGLLDSHQQKAKKQSMYSLAKTLSPPLPPTFVELRHQATHEMLPSLGALRSGTAKALAWLWEYYWCKLEAPLSVLLLKYLSSGGKGELDVEKFGVDKVLRVLEEVEAGYAGDDPGFLLRVVELRERLRGNDDTSSEDGDAVGKSVEDMMRDLEELQRDVSDQEEEEEDDDIQRESQVSSQKKKKPWRKWEGEWIPTPIGTIS